MTFDAQDRCEVCGRFVQTLAPGVSWSQSWGYCMDGSPDIYDPTYRCSPCTDAYGVRPSNCAPSYGGNGRNPPQRASPAPASTGRVRPERKPMDKTLDLDELERVAKRATQARRYRVGPKVYARGHGVPLLTVNDLGPSLGQQDEDATYIATFDPPTILTLIAAARPAVVSDEVVSTLTKAFWAEYAKSDRGTTAMRAALALLPGGVPDGYMLVPREPTEAMIRSGQGAADDKYWLWRGLGERPVGSGLDGMALYVDAAYRAMLSASPKGSSRSLPSRTAQEPPSPTPCDLEGEKRLHEMTPEEFAAYSRTLGDA